MPTPFHFLRRNVAYNSETECFNITNSSSGPLFLFSNISAFSETGCPYFILRVLKNSIVHSSYATSSLSQNSNTLTIPVSIFLEPGSNVSLTFTNLDPLQQLHNIEGNLS